MSQNKDGPRHGTTVGRYLPGMTNRSDEETIAEYTREFRGEDQPRRAESEHRFGSRKTGKK